MFQSGFPVVTDLVGLTIALMNKKTWKDGGRRQTIQIRKKNESDKIIRVWLNVKK